MGYEIVKKDVSIKDRNKALELLGKYYGSWTDKLDANIKTPNIIFDVGNKDE